MMTLFIIYGAFNTSMGAHDWVYPNEIFPTYIRGTAMGFITSMTRIVSAVGTFLFPTILAAWGLAATLYICAGLFFVGVILTAVMAPETKNMNLNEIAKLNGPKKAVNK